MADDGLEDFTRTSFRHDGTDHPVLRSGTGPAVVVLGPSSRSCILVRTNHIDQ